LWNSFVINAIENEEIETVLLWFEKCGNPTNIAPNTFTVTSFIYLFAFSNVIDY
jgi:hypothetical protein